MAWFKIDDGLHSSRKLLSIPKRTRFAAVGLWTVAGSWSADQLTDGAIPDYMLEVWGAPPSAPQALVDAGLWDRESGSHVFRNWHEYQPSKQDVDGERAAQRDRMRELRAKRKGVKALEQREQGATCDSTPPHGAEHVPDPDPVPVPVPLKDSSSEVANATPRPEVVDLLDLLDSCIQGNGLKAPSRNKANTSAMRLLIDRDEYTPDQVAWIIRWATKDEFWRTNILSASKLREKFPQLMAKAGVGQTKTGEGFNGEIDADKILGKDYWQPGQPPEGLTVREEIAWKKQQRAEHEIEREHEAREKVNNGTQD